MPSKSGNILVRNFNKWPRMSGHGNIYHHNYVTGRKISMQYLPFSSFHDILQIFNDPSSPKCICYVMYDMKMLA